MLYQIVARNLNALQLLSRNIGSLCGLLLSYMFSHDFILGKHLDALVEVFAERGLILRHGKWEFQENRRLHDNFTTFAREFKEVIGNPVDFVVTSEDKERHNDVQKLV